MRFEKINKIEPSHSNTWQNKMFVTIDIDWASDIVINDTIDIIEHAGINATWFITHNTPVLKRLQENKNFELGIHPNFNFLLNGDKRNGINSEEIINNLLKIVPEAKSIRSHFLTQSAFLFQKYKEKGLTHHCNTYIPYSSEIVVKPWNLLNSMVECPHYWEDDVECFSDNMKTHNPTEYNGLKIYDFHPIHIFLNSENIQRYDAAKPFLNNYTELKKNVNNNNYGTRDFLLDLTKHK